ncbi:immunity protein Tsi6 family protein [Pseudomonas putida]|uniref:immunity protein Tsi6 family protein n=1 Tax=Pseudomonas putida TaxID=303 RepID=UPI000CD40F2C|nr:immunity protein Tsi6 family protein [Pseudomonas putida]POF93653.1 hypothetical protein BGP83_13475 [Pseudomonas putida]
MKPTTPLGYVQKAIDMTAQRNKACPAYPIYGMLLNQLDYVKAVFEGREQDKSKLYASSVSDYEALLPWNCSPEIPR